MTVSAKQVHDSLVRHAAWLKPGIHEELVAGMKADGLIHDDGTVHAVAERFPAVGDNDATVIAAAARGLCKMTPVQARAVAQHDHNLMRIFNFVQARAAKYGISLGDQELNIRDIDAALKTANVSLDDRMLFKGKLRELRLI